MSWWNGLYQHGCEETYLCLWLSVRLKQHWLTFWQMGCYACCSGSCENNGKTFSKQLLWKYPPASHLSCGYLKNELCCLLGRLGMFCSYYFKMLQLIICLILITMECKCSNEGSLSPWLFQSLRWGFILIVFKSCRSILGVLLLISVIHRLWLCNFFPFLQQQNL